MHRVGTSILRVLLTIVLVALLAACSNINGPTPNKKLVRKAIALQLDRTQQELTEQLHLSETPKSEIARVQITKKEPLIVQDLPTFRVRGTCNLNVKLSKRQVTQRQNPFDVYLQRQIENQTWRLLRRQLTDEGSQTWYSYLIPSN